MGLCLLHDLRSSQSQGYQCGEVYNHVIKKDEKEIDFVMNPGDFIAGRNTWIRSIFSITLLVFYFSLIITMGGVIVYLAIK